MDETQSANQTARDQLLAWKAEIAENGFDRDLDFQHTIQYYFSDKPGLAQELQQFSEQVHQELEAVVAENDLRFNLPRLEPYDGVGQRIESVVHHPNYANAGNIIYGSRLLERMSQPGGLLEALSFFFVSTQVGEAGHNCPIACSAGIIRVLSQQANFSEADEYIQALIKDSFDENFTGAQFLTEVQGGSDVGQNAVMATQADDGTWRIRGEKWFCSNANADLILMTARFDETTPGTKGLGLFLVPAKLPDGSRNHYSLRRLKEKLGTRAMASSEIDFHGAVAYAMEPVDKGIYLVLEHVLHLSRLFNAISVLGMSNRAYHVAKCYAKHRVAFGHPIIQYPMVQENLAVMRAENVAVLASVFFTVKMQDDFDQGKIEGDDTKLLLRLFSNINKYISALWSVEHIHHAIDVLAGNGAIESFSPLPRLFRDSIVCENWEGTHNTLRMQILRDMLKYKIDELLMGYILEQLNALNTESKQLPVIHQGLETLRHLCRDLKDSPEALQLIKIKRVVDQMAYVTCALLLFNESEDQAEQQGRQTKQAALDLFCQTHLQDGRIEYNEAYLTLISDVIK